MLLYRSLNFILIFTVCLGSCSILKNLKHFDTLHVSEIRHNVFKREINGSSRIQDKIKELHFSTLGRDFHLILSPNQDVLHQDFQAYIIDGQGVELKVAIDPGNFYDGTVLDVTSSYASVHLEDGIMSTCLGIPGETYHIEPAWRHLPELGNETMIAYKESDINSGISHPCEQPDWYDFDKLNEEQLESSIEDRVKRLAEHEYHPIKSRCPLLLVADYTFYQNMGGSNATKTINYLINLITNVNKIFKRTVWYDGTESEGPKGMGFIIKNIIVHAEPTTVRDGDAHYNMNRESWVLKNLLEIFSRESSHKDYCLAYLFTHRNFGGGKLGFAYTASPSLTDAGGICAPASLKRGCLVYMNAGVVSSRNIYGGPVMTREALMFAAHELGHSWGAEHDPNTPECSPPASQGGPYIMYPHSYNNSPILSNNQKFSPCSSRSIKKVLLAKSGMCFVPSEEYSCGNSVVEDGEECDAGFLGIIDEDPCCDKHCKLRRDKGAICSDKNSPCCQGCRFARKWMKCRERNPGECRRESRCTGTHPECPESVLMVDGSECLDMGRCQAGICVPYCESQGYLSCKCDPDGEYACKRCCRKDLSASCSPTPPHENLPNRTPCYRGFCYGGVCEYTGEPVIECF